MVELDGVKIYHKNEIWEELKGHHVEVKGGRCFFNPVKGNWVIAERLLVHLQDSPETIEVYSWSTTASTEGEAKGLADSLHQFYHY